MEPWTTELPHSALSDLCQRLLLGASTAEISSFLKDAGVSKLGHRAKLLQLLQGRSQRAAKQLRDALAPLGISPVSDASCAALLTASGDHQQVLTVLRDNIGVKRMGLRHRAASALAGVALPPSGSDDSSPALPVPAVKQTVADPSPESSTGPVEPRVDPAGTAPMMPCAAGGDCTALPSQHGSPSRQELAPSMEATRTLQLALPLLTRGQLEAIQFDAHAADVPVDFERMAPWTEEQAHTYFESGGNVVPEPSEADDNVGTPAVDISDAAMGSARRAPLALFWCGMLSHSRFRCCRNLAHRHHVYRIPALVRTPNALLAFAEARASSDDHGHIDLVYRRSSDGGATWGDVHLVPAHEPHAYGQAAEEETVGNPVPIFNPRTSELLLLCCSNVSREGEGAIRSGQVGVVGRRVWLLRSSDEGLTWSRRRELTAQVKQHGWTWYATGPGGGIVLTDGTLAVPATHAEGISPIGSGGDHSHVLLSYDDGETWHVGGDGSVHTNEATIAQLADGSLLLNARSVGPSGLRTLQRSSDGGKTWGDAWTCEELREAPPHGCHGSMVAKPGGRGLFFCGLDVQAATTATAWQQHRCPVGRQRLSVRRSDDSGRRWDTSVLLHAGPAGYSSLCLLEGERGVGGGDGEGEREGKGERRGEGEGNGRRALGGGPGVSLGVLYERGEEPSAFFAQSIVFEQLHDERLLGERETANGAAPPARSCSVWHNNNAQALEETTVELKPMPTLLAPVLPAPTLQSPFEVELGPLPGEAARGPSSAPPLRYRPRHPELFLADGAPFRDEWLDSGVVSALDSLKAAGAMGMPAGGGGASTANRRAQRGLRQILHEELAGRVYSFPLLTPAFCEMLVAEVEHYEASGLPSHRPNTMNNYGLILNQIGLRPLLTALQSRVILPFSSLIFPAEGSEFTEHYSFVCQYKVDEDTHLDMHHDDSGMCCQPACTSSCRTRCIGWLPCSDDCFDARLSPCSHCPLSILTDVTLNVCIGKEFGGATLTFCGSLFDNGTHRKHAHTYTHQLGRAVLHLGTHRHGADSITWGERYSLIVWSKGPFRETEAFKQRYADRMQQGTKGDAPDLVCLSYTHDPDYGEFQPYPHGKEPNPAARRRHLDRFSAAEAAGRAADLRQGGADDFRRKDWRAAAAKYESAVEYAAWAGRAAGPGAECALLLNEAQARLNLQQHDHAAHLCSRALEIEPASVKGLYRRALARLELREFGAARTDLVAAARLEPGNRSVREKLELSREAALAERAHERKIAAAMMRK